MSGHSKWKNIQHRKGAQDAKRSKEFQKLAKEIFVAAKNGEPNPESNPTLRAVIDKARAKSMPKDNIERAIERARGGKDGDNFDEIVYEGYAANGVAVMVYCLTDNRNRTAAFVKSTFSKRGGNLGADGSVSYLFNRKGEIAIEQSNLNMDVEEFELALMDFDIEDMTNDDGIIVITIDPKNFSDVKAQIDELDVVSEYLNAEISMVPTMEIDLNEEQQEKVQALLDILEDNDDVQDVYHNMA